MDFSLCPNAGPPRLLRFVTAESMPRSTTLAMLDAKNNVLFINGDLYAELEQQQQHRLIRTRLPVVDNTTTL